MHITGLVADEVTISKARMPAMKKKYIVTLTPEGVGRPRFDGHLDSMDGISGSR